MNSTGLLTLAASLPTDMIDKMAHALGWPQHGAIRLNAHRVKWRNPHQNYWFGRDDESAWLAAQVLGLATAELHGMRFATWRVTPLGITVTRLRLQAIREAARLEKT